VAELTLLLILLTLRQVHRLDRMFKQGEPWSTMRALPIGQELAGQRVGVVGAGYTGRQVISRLRALGADLWVYDPFLSAQKAETLGVHSAPLDDLFAHCSIVTMQAPPTEETYHMVGAKQLALLRDDAIFVNTARSHLVDEQALLAELQSGRIQAALDVFDQEPLPEDSPFRQLDNVVLTPHIAGASRQARLRQGDFMVDEVRRFFAAQPLLFQVTAEMLDNMA
jgi:phosphoglycerate dehydrogenase-like enzyme